MTGYFVWTTYDAMRFGTRFGSGFDPRQPRGNSTMAYENSDNGAEMAGYTVQYLADCADYSMHISVKPDADLDGRFRAFDHDNQEYVTINGWLWSFEPIEA